MEVVSENSEAELARRRREDEVADALEQLGGRLRTLATNLLRIIRGAGKPSEIVFQAMTAYHEAAGRWPRPAGPNHRCVQRRQPAGDLELCL
jgi:hypothetical protein